MSLGCMIRTSYRGGGGIVSGWGQGGSDVGHKGEGCTAGTRRWERKVKALKDGRYFQV